METGGKIAVGVVARPWILRSVKIATGISGAGKQPVYLIGQANQSSL